MDKVEGLNGKRLAKMLEAEKKRKENALRANKIENRYQVPALRTKGVPENKKAFEAGQTKAEETGIAEVMLADRLKEIESKKMERLANSEAKFPISELELVKRRDRQPCKKLWNEEYIKEVALDMAKYIDSSDFPTVAEFCYTRGIYSARLGESEILRELKDLMHAKCVALGIRRGLALDPGEGALSSFLQKLLMNMGSHSLTERTEVEHSGGIHVTASALDEKI